MFNLELLPVRFRHSLISKYMYIAKVSNWNSNKILSGDVKSWLVLRRLVGRGLDDRIKRVGCNNSFLIKKTFSDY